MRNDLKNSLYSVIASIFMSFLIIVVSSLIACKYEDPNSIASTAAIIALIGGSLICGITSSVLSHGFSFTTIISGLIYIGLIIAASIIAGHFMTPTMKFGLGKKMILYTVSAVAILTGSLLAQKRKKKRRSVNAVRTNIKRKVCQK